MQKQGTITRAISFLLLGSLIGWQASTLDLGNSKAEFRTSSSEESRADLDLSLFWDVKDMVDKSYVNLDSITTQKELYGAISGLVESLDDPYSVFMSPEETDQFNSSLSGELEGIGAELTVKDGALTVLAPLKDSPAEKAGLLPGDFIYKVEGVLTSDMTLFDAIMAIRGASGTSVNLTILRKGADAAIDMNIMRAAINVPSVEFTTLEKNGKQVAHLSIYQFGNDTYNEFEEAVRDITLSGPDGLIIDLRMNGGGYLDTAVQIVSEFFKEQKTAVIVKYRDRDNEVIKTTGDGQLTEIPIVVLIDEGSASASEILAGALQDYARATLIGEQSFGKGSVQELDELSDGSTLRLTVAKWFTPLDHSIDHTGITPDIEVVNEGSVPAEGEDDIQLNAAVDYLIGL